MQYSTAGANTGYEHNTVSVCRIVLFESGAERLFSQKTMLHILLNEAAGTVIEKNVSDLQQGDYLVFKNFGDQAGDIVDELLQKLVTESGFQHGSFRGIRVDKTMETCTRRIHAVSKNVFPGRIKKFGRFRAQEA